ncbi:hypothetical protein [Metasolibacillus meyeri]|uniref:hypothetical protein n=1 Tax=Metasolibacillus meyeri TaxID=1071052 RepID=UPI00187D183F|nr:hypothetical protein [Metasolibacillus meyeri]
MIFEDESNLIYQYKVEFGMVEQYTVSTTKNVNASFQKSFLSNEIEFKHREEN